MHLEENNDIIYEENLKLYRRNVRFLGSGETSEKLKTSANVQNVSEGPNLSVWS